jgi:hypothetical protein
MCHVTVLVRAVIVLFVSVMVGGCGVDNSPGPANHSPVILTLTASPGSVRALGIASIICGASDRDGDPISYEWTAQGGSLSEDGDSVSWTAPLATGAYKIHVLVTDGRGGLDFDSLRVSVTPGGPLIRSLTATPSVLAPSETVALVCEAESNDPDSVRYAWDAEAGVFDGAGPSVTWTAPAADGIREIRVTVSDRSGIARDTISVDVFGGTFLVRTDEGLMAVGLDGSYFRFASTTAPVEVVGTKIFVKDDHSIAELGHTGTPHAVVSVTNPAATGEEFVVLPDASFVFLDNDQDKLHFIDADGSFYDTVLLPDPSPGIRQHVGAVMVDNTLVVSETGTGKLVAVELSDLSASIFRSFDPRLGPLGPLDFANGVFYLGISGDIYRFAEGGPIVGVGTVPAGDIASIVKLGRYLYVVVDEEGTVRRVHSATGEAELVASGLVSPRDIEYIPVRLAP